MLFPGGLMVHTPVMVTEVLHYLLHQESRLILDATVGCGGHAEAILASRKSLSMICFDRDARAVEAARKRLKAYGERVFFHQGLFTDLEKALLSRGNVDGVLVDHGLSSLQLDDPHRGFSYLYEGPLDMRMGGEGPTAEELIRTSSEAELAATFERYGEVKRPRGIARRVKAAAAAGKMRTTEDLANAVHAAFGRRAAPATLSRVFQALRIAVNDELRLLGEFLDGILKFAGENARLVFITYHSLEDRMVKEFFKKESAACICPPVVPVCVCGREPRIEVLTKKAVKTSREEIERNPRSRSARLRAARVLR